MIRNSKDYVIVSKILGSSLESHYFEKITKIRGLSNEPIDLKLSIQEYLENNPQDHDLSLLVDLFEVSVVSEPIELTQEQAQRLAVHFTSPGNLMAKKVVDYPTLLQLYRHICPSLDIVARYYEVEQFKRFYFEWDNLNLNKDLFYLELCRNNRSDLVKQMEVTLDLVEFAREYGNQNIVTAAETAIATGRYL